MPRGRSRSVPSRRRKDRRREARIVDEIVVDAYGPEERALSWYYYLEEHLRFPFTAICVARRATSPLRVGEKVTITALAPEDDCGRDLIVLTKWNGRSFGAPLSQLEPHDVDAATAEAIADWNYWLAMGYQF